MNPPIARGRSGPEAAVVAVAARCVASDDLPAVRKAPGPPVGPRLSPSLLKHADEQSIAGLSAVLRAIPAAGLSGTSFEDWAVLAAPRYLGRIQAASHLDRFLRQGASAVSPLIIPNLSLHSPSGTISLAIGARGTNHGVGGAHGNPGEALLAAIAALDDPATPGLWLVATQWDPEPVAADEPGRLASGPSAVYAVALALRPAGAVAGGALGMLRIVDGTAAVDDEADVAGLARALIDAGTGPLRRLVPLPGGLAVELDLARAASAFPPALAG